MTDHSPNLDPSYDAFLRAKIGLAQSSGMPCELATPSLFDLEDVRPAPSDEVAA